MRFFVGEIALVILDQLVIQLEHVAVCVEHVEPLDRHGATSLVVSSSTAKVRHSPRGRQVRSARRGSRAGKLRGIERVGQPVARTARPFIALPRGTREPDIGGDGIAPHTAAAQIHFAQIDLGDRIARLGGAGILRRRAGEIDRPAGAAVVEIGNRGLGRGIAAAGRARSIRGTRWRSRRRHRPARRRRNPRGWVCADSIAWASRTTARERAGLIAACPGRPTAGPDRPVQRTPRAAAASGAANSAPPRPCCPSARPPGRRSTAPRGYRGRSPGSGR